MNEEETLALARTLIDHGVPVIVCKPRGDGDEVVPIVAWRTITDAAQCRGMIARYEHGRDALALIGGYGVDLIDVDTKAGGSIEPFGDFKHWGVTRTPSGGRHYVVPSAGVAKIQDLRVGGRVVGDYIGGTESHESRMLGFLPGSVRPKYGDVQYAMEEPWDVEGAVRSEPEAAVVALLHDAARPGGTDVEVYLDDSAERDPAAGVHPYAQAAIDSELGRLRDLPRPWAPGSYWDTTTYEVACSLLRLANSNWTGYSEDDALADLLGHAPTDERWGEREHKAKWRSAKDSVGAAGRRPPADAASDFAVVPGPPVQRRPTVDVTASALPLDWIAQDLGREGTPSAGLFRRGDDLVFTPRVGEAGYVPPRDGAAHDGPAQVRRMNATALAGYLDLRYTVVKRDAKGGFTPTQFPREVAARAVEMLPLMETLRPLRGVTHTPVVRADGSVLWEAGYDAGSGVLHLPEPGLVVPRDGGGGTRLLDRMLDGFPFVTVHDRANFIGALLTPILRPLVPPPYPLVAIGAPSPGSGKSLAARLLRIVHGGVFRSEMVRDGAELRKQITSILDTTAAPVVTFDNLTGTLRSPVIDGLLTSAEWSDRILGATEDRTLPNDRLWTLTGNNLRLGGDLRRRTVWVTIDPGVEHPETRRFDIEDLPAWVAEHRGQILAALLGMVEEWVAAGMPAADPCRTDDFARWQQVVGGVLAHAGVPGTLNHRDSVRELGLEDEDDLAAFLAVVEQCFGADRFLAKQVVAAVDFGDIDGDHMPGEVLEKGRYDQRAASKSLGRWLAHRSGRWAGGRVVEQAGKNRDGVMQWRVVGRDPGGAA